MSEVLSLQEQEIKVMWRRWSLWASGRMARRLAAGLPASAGVGLVRRVRGRQTARIVSFKNRLKYTCSAAATKLLDFVLHFPFLVIVSPLRNSGPCDSFDYLGHSNNVDDDDDDDDEWAEFTSTWGILTLI